MKSLTLIAATGFALFFLVQSVAADTLDDCKTRNASVPLEPGVTLEQMQAGCDCLAIKTKGKPELEAEFAKIVAMTDVAARKVEAARIPAYAALVKECLPPAVMN